MCSNAAAETTSDLSTKISPHSFVVALSSSFFLSFFPPYYSEQRAPGLCITDICMGTLRPQRMCWFSCCAAKCYSECCSRCFSTWPFSTAHSNCSACATLRPPYIIERTSCGHGCEMVTFLSWGRPSPETNSIKGRNKVSSFRMCAGMEIHPPYINPLELHYLLLESPPYSNGVDCSI